jgi:hypothetical protein
MLSTPKKWLENMIQGTGTWLIKAGVDFVLCVTRLRWISGR